MAGRTKAHGGGARGTEKTSPRKGRSGVSVRLLYRLTMQRTKRRYPQQKRTAQPLHSERLTKRAPRRQRVRALDVCRELM